MDNLQIETEADMNQPTETELPQPGGRLLPEISEIELPKADPVAQNAKKLAAGSLELSESMAVIANETLVRETPALTAWWQKFFVEKGICPAEDAERAHSELIRFETAPAILNFKTALRKQAEKLGWTGERAHLAQKAEQAILASQRWAIAHKGLSSEAALAMLAGIELAGGEAPEVASGEKAVAFCRRQASRSFAELHLGFFERLNSAQDPQKEKSALQAMDRVIHHEDMHSLCFSGAAIPVEMQEAMVGCLVNQKNEAEMAQMGLPPGLQYLVKRLASPSAKTEAFESKNVFIHLAALKEKSDETAFQRVLTEELAERLADTWAAEGDFQTYILMRLQGANRERVINYIRENFAELGISQAEIPRSFADIEQAQNLLGKIFDEEKELFAYLNGQLDPKALEARLVAAGGIDWELFDEFDDYWFDDDLEYYPTSIGGGSQPLFAPQLPQTNYLSSFFNWLLGGNLAQRDLGPR